MYRRRFVRARRSRRSVRQTGFKSYSSRVGAGVPQSRLARMPRVERCKFLDLNWTHLANTNYYETTPMVCTLADCAFDPAIQGSANKRMLNLVKNGSNNNDRTSARIFMKSVLLRGTVYYAPLVDATANGRVAGGSLVATGSGSTTRGVLPSEVDRTVVIYVVYYPRLSHTSMASWESLLEKPVSTQALQDETNIFGARVLLRKQFKMYLDPLGPQGGVPFFALGRGSRRDFSWKINLNLPAEWDNVVSDNPSLSSLKFGHLAIYALSNVDSGVYNAWDGRSSSMPYVSLRARLAFVDA